MRTRRSDTMQNGDLYALSGTSVSHNDDGAVDAGELAAVQAVLRGDLRARIQLGVRALRTILKDPNDTKQVFVLFLVLNARSLPGFLARFVAEPDGVALLHEKPAIDSSSVDFAALGALPADTLGGAFARHLSERNLSPDIFRAPPGVPASVAFLAQRMRQSHDLWHVVTGYDTSVADELALLAFSHAQSRLPGPAVLAVTGALRFSLEHPNALRKVWDGYRRGKAAKSLLTVRWEELWTSPLSVVREQLGIVPRAI